MEGGRSIKQNPRAPKRSLGSLWLLLSGLALFAALATTEVRAQDTDLAYTVSIGTSTADIGTQTSVELTLSDIEADPVGAWTIDVEFLDGIISPVECELYTNSVCDLARDPGMFRISGASAEGITEDVVLARITFACSMQGSSPLTLFIRRFDDGGVSYDLRKEDGAIVCREAGERLDEPKNLPLTGDGPGKTLEFVPPVGLMFTLGVTFLALAWTLESRVRIGRLRNRDWSE